MHALNDAKTHAQQGCAMQFSGITLKESLMASQTLPGVKDDVYLHLQITNTFLEFKMERNNPKGPKEHSTCLKIGHQGLLRPKQQ